MANEDKLRDYLKLVTANLRQTRRRLREVEEKYDGPIAIVGMGCRFPGGVRAPEDLWRLVTEGTDAISDFPEDRGWDTGELYDPEPDHPGTSCTRHGGFLYDAADFDAEFFGISPREALAMDPQQRLLLEVAWEALERAGIDPRSLSGSATGVFAGGYATGYGMDRPDDGDADGVEGHLLTGVATSVLSGRVAFTLGLEGPALTVDTACSSSLVALHLACQALRAREATLALAAGVTVLASPGVFVGFSRQRGVAPDGRCKPFSARADGTGWAEGAGVLVVERLPDAIRNGRDILAVVSGSAVNSDGASNGLTAPNGPSQQRVILAALAAARLSPAEVDAVEAHGTGTALGDPIEAQALIDTYGRDRPEGRPLWLGAVKSNIGHTQAAAGVAGVIKTVLALGHGQLPRTLHADVPSPHVDWTAGDLRLLTDPVPWPAGDTPRRAGVSSFGLSGTNAHVIIADPPAPTGPVLDGEAPEDPEADASAAAAADSTAPEPETISRVIEAGPGVTAWLVSARSEAALAAQAGQLADWVATRPDLDPASVAWSLATTRTTFEHRAVVTGTGQAELETGLRALAAGAPAAHVVPDARVLTGTAGGTAGPVCFLFAGQGSQRAGMGAGLYAASPVFAAAFDQACELLEAELRLPVAEVVLGSVTGGGATGGKVNDPRADQTVYAQAGLFAVQAGLVALLRACGIAPGAVAGHSVGEIAAAWTAGVLSLEDACRLVAARARLMQALPPGGAMCAIAASEQEVTAVISAVARAGLSTGAPVDGISVAAVNGPAAVVVSGDEAAVAAVASVFRDRGARTKALRVSHAFHSARMDPVLAELDSLARTLPHAEPRVPWAGALDGDLVTSPDPGYWAVQARRPVRFAAALAALAARGTGVFLEIGPDSTLSALGPAVVEAPEALEAPGHLEKTGRRAVFIPVQRPDMPAADAILAALAGAHVAGAAVDWASVLPARQRVELPTYPFQRQRYWLAAAGRKRAAPVLGPMPGASWQEPGWIPLADTGTAALAGPWLLAAAGDAQNRSAETALTAGCAAALAGHGATVTVVTVNTGDAERTGLAASVSRALAGGERPAGVVSLLTLDEGTLPDAPTVPAGLAGTLALLQVLGDAGAASPLWVVTRGAVAAVPGDVPSSPAQAQAWELHQDAAARYGDQWGGLIDLPLPAEPPAAVAGPTVDKGTGSRLAAVLAGCGANQVAIRRGGAFTRRPPGSWRYRDGLGGAGERAAAGGQDRGVSGADAKLVRELAAVPEVTQLRMLTDLVRTHAAAVLKYPSAESVAPGRPFSELGFESLTAIEMRNRLSAVTGLTLPATLLFDYPAPDVLARCLRSELLGLPLAADAAPGPVSTGPVNTGSVGEPVAVVGMSCRFAGGADSPDELWEILAAGTDVVGGFPRDRGWDTDRLYDPDPEHPGTSYVREGAFLYGAGDFDPAFFGISPREALAMDPQQRLFLEVAWEAVERAGIDPGALRGTRTGVWAGGSYTGYAMVTAPETGSIEAHMLTGVTTSALSGRVAYSLGLEGPAVTVDTACSSALVALHLACQALRSGECSLALAGGAHVAGSPSMFVWTSRQRGLSADGRCKSFGAAADGMGIAEGAGMLVLERLSDARRNGHPVLAVIRGSAVNQDGASNGLTAPNGPAQQRVIRAALANAGLAPADVDVVEAHGSGTVLGDPIEAQALIATYGRDRSDGRPLWLGSVKSNVGHTQAAAGAAGMLKMVLSLQRGLLPATLHVGEPSPHVDWSAGGVRLLAEPVSWPSNGRPRRAGVSAFGVSGTNAHVIIEEPPAPAGEPPAPPVPAESLVPPVLPEPARPTPVLTSTAGCTAWLVSARSAAGLAAQAARLTDWAAVRPGLEAGDVAWSLAATRSVLEHRAVVLGAGRDELVAGLGALAAGRPAAGVVTGHDQSGPVTSSTGRSSTGQPGAVGKLVFVFAGQGAHWAGMGAELAEASPVFAARLAQCGAALAPHVDWDLMDVLTGAPGAPGLDRADVAQPALWAVMVGLAAVWQAAGVFPDAVIGHSQGEIAAATVAGILSLDDAAAVVAIRGRALTRLNTPGGMLSVVMPAPAVRELLTRWRGRLQVAAVNSPAATVVSGHPAALAELEAELAARRVLRWPVPGSDYVAHSAAVEDIRPVLDAELGAITPRAGQVPLYSTVTCQWADGPDLDAAYWYANVRQEVRFAEAVTELAASGYRAFIEVSPHQVLTTAITETTRDSGIPGPVLVTGTLDREDGGPRRLLTALASAHVGGAGVDMLRVLPAGQRVDLPTYAFQRQRYWLRPSVGTENQASTRGASAVGGDGASTAAEARFWAAVEDGDLGEIARAVGAGTLLAEDTVLAEAPAKDTLPAEDRLGPLRELLPALASWRRRERDQAVMAGWWYQVDWVPVSDPGPAALPGTWLVVTPDGDAGTGVAEWCASALAARGARVITVPVRPAEVGPAEACTGVGREALAAAISEARSGSAPAEPERPVAGVVSLLALDETPLPGFPAVPAGLAGTLALVQALGDTRVDTPLWLVTRGAVATTPGEALPSPVQALAWGFARVAGGEHPDRWGGLIDLPPVLDERPALNEMVGARLSAVLAGCGEDQVAIRPGGILARRLVRAGQPHAGVSSHTGSGRWVPSGSVLITGGTGAIGGRIARLSAERGAPRIVLSSRSGPAAMGVPTLAAELAVAGAAVQVTACDGGERDAVAGLLGGIAVSGPPLTAVFHAAVVLDDGVVDRLDAGRLATVLAPKSAAAAHLDELTTDLGLDAFVLFSSIAGTLGGSGQGSYAAANAYLDALAENRRSRGLPALSVAWGRWAGGGAGQATEASMARLRRNRWEVLMDPSLAMRALSQAMDGDDAVRIAMDFDWAQLAHAPGAAALFQVPFTRDLPEVRQLAATTVTASGGDQAAGTFRQRLAAEPSARQEELLTELIRTQAAVILGHSSPDEVEPRRAFSEMGFDSLTAVELRNQLSAATGLRLPATLLFDYPAPAVLAGFLQTALAPATGDQSAARIAERTPAPAATVPSDLAEPVAIVGMSCRFPGGVGSPEELWELLAAGTDAVSAFPSDRGWDTDGLYDPDPAQPGTSYVREGGFLHDAGDFDPAFFGISPREALAMDPQQRLLLELSWEAVERAGIDPASLTGSPSGVFIGGYGSGYAVASMGSADDQPAGVEGHLVTGNATSIISGRVAYTLGLEGPAVTVDTACSSSMVALHLACQALRSGECALALAGGVTIMATPWEIVGLSRQRALAADGRSKAFAADADGMGMAEGAGMLALMRLSDARRGGHRVLAVITGTAVNSDGASNGLTAPNGPSQQRVIRTALASAGLSGADIDVVEAHGTGTALGDPIEVQALMAVYGQGRPAGRPLLLGSVKSNIGHTQAAAGVAGVMKMVLALRHQELPRTLYAEEPSPHIDWSAGDIRLLTEAAPWPSGGGGEEAGGDSAAGRPRRAGVSSFGFSGTNAHVIIEEAPAFSLAVHSRIPGTPVAGEPDVITGARQAKTSDAAAEGVQTEPPDAGEDDTPGSGRAASGPAPDPGQSVLTPGQAVWLLSAKTAAALAAQAERLARWAAADEEFDPAHVAWSLATTRSMFAHRAVVTGAGRDELVAGLRTVASSGPDAGAGPPEQNHEDAGRPAGLNTGSVPAGGPGRTAFLFAGQGSQRAGMAAGLYGSSRVFAAAFDAAAGLLEAELGVPVAEVALGQGPGGPDDPRADQTLFAQPCLFAFQAGLVALLAACGIAPDAVAGHSVGEIAAAYTAGGLSLKDACRLVAARARGMARLPAGGAMCAIAAPEAEVATVLAGFGAGVTAVLAGDAAAVAGQEGTSAVTGQVSLAAVNGPAAVVVSGEESAVRRVAEVFAGRGTRTRMLRVSHAFHSARMDPALAALGEVARGLTQAVPRIPWVGALDGNLVTHPDPEYWAAAARQPVRFADAVATLAAEGVRVFIEIGPDGTLSALGPAAVEAAGGGRPPAVFIPVQRPGTPAPAALLTALSRAHVTGVPVDWASLLPAGDPVELPTYAFQRQRFWTRMTLGPATGRSRAIGAGGREDASTAAEARFWAAVADGDLAEVAAELAVDARLPLSEALPALASWRQRERAESAVVSWRYRISWAPVSGPGTGDVTGTWLVVVPAGNPGKRHAALAHWCAAALTAGGAEVATVPVDPAASRERLAAAVSQVTTVRARAEAAPDNTPVAGVLSLLALDETPLPGHAAVPAGLAATLSLVQALGDLRVQAPLWVLTSGAVAATPGEAPARPVQAQAWGLGRVVALEHPDFGGGLIDVTPVLDDPVLDDPVLDDKAGPGDRLVPDERAVLDERMGDLLRSVLAGCGEDQVAIRRSGLLARRLVRADHPRPDRSRPGQPRPADPDRARAWTPRGTALVTGGTGAIGGHVARWLAGRGAPRVILTSRSGPVAVGVPQLAAQLAAAGTAVEVTACDSADRGALAGLLAGIAAAPGCPSLTSVFHAAGAGESAAVYDVSAADLAVVTGAKAAGAAYLDELTAGTELDAFVLFSSIAATWGSALQPGYAAANAFLDAVAEHRRGRGLQATSIAWGPWSGGGMTDAGSTAQLRRRGLRPMDPGEAVAALGQVLDAGEATVTVADVDWARFVPPFTLRRASPLIESLPEVRQALTGNSSPAGEQSEHAEAGALARRLAELPRAEQDQLLTELVQAQAATVLGHESALAVQADHAFSDLGADSLTAVELRDRLMAATGVRLPATLLFDYPTPLALASYLRLTMTSDGQAAPRPVLAELDRLESALDAMTPGDNEAARITARLESVMAKWKGIAAGVSREFVTAKLESSSDTEVFDFIVNELGIN